MLRSVVPPAWKAERDTRFNCAKTCHAMAVRYFAPIRLLFVLKELQTCFYSKSICATLPNGPSNYPYAWCL